MKTKLFYLISLLMLSMGMKAQNISIPDANFKAKLLSSSSSNTIAKDINGNYFKIDANGDGEIQQSEANNVSALEIINPNNTNPIQNYLGIVSFNNIKKIKIDYYSVPDNNLNLSNLNYLEDLDIAFQTASSFNPGILSVNNCSNLKNLHVNVITLQNLTNTPSVKNVDIFINTFGNVQNILNDLGNLNNLEKIRLYTSGTFNLGTPTGILNLSYHPFLKEVDIDYLKISELNLSHCNLLDTVDINMGYNLPNQNPNYFGSLNVDYCPSLTAINLAGDSNITELTANNCTNLQSIDCHSEFLGNFSASNCPLLNEIKLTSFSSSNPFQITNCPSLKNIQIDKYGNDTFDATNAVNLEHLYLGSPWYYPGYNTNFFGTLQNLTISNNLKLKTLGLRNHTLTQLNINGLPKLENVSLELSYNTGATYTPQPNFATEFLQSINIQNCPLLTSVTFPGQKGLKNITIKNCGSLTNLEHSNSSWMAYPEFGELKTVDIQDCAALSSVNFSYNQMNDFKLKNTGAATIDISHNELTNFELVNNNNLATILASKNKLASLNFSTLPNNLQTLDSSFNLITSVTGTSSSMKTLEISNNNLTDFNIHNLPNLEIITIGRNKILDVDFSGHTKIKTIYEFDYSNYFGNPGFTNPPTFTKTFNVNNCTNLETVILESSSLEKVFAKNGLNEAIHFQMGSYPNLQYICCDASQIADLQASLAMDGIVCNLNDYCNFIPGGDHNTITGTVRFDENNNGCDTNDEVFEHLKLKISNGTTTSETFVKSNGEYNLYNSQAGNYTVTAEPENASLFTVTPSTFTTNFANSNNNIFTQNICVTKNGNAKDLEIVIAPVINARPGFDAVYKLIWRNKGNTALSGSAVLTFDNSRMSFVSSTLPSTVSGNQVTFNFNNLKPYANSSSEIKFTINPPTHPSYPVNNGDILNFTANITPLSGDLNPDDNSFNYKETVVGSYDPNDITCLEGSQIPVAMVGKDLHYIVNFENTGTASAVNIVVEMEINPDDFDINTLQLQNTSHNTYTKITGNKVEFMMKNINLAALANGNVALKIKSKNNLISGDTVMNKANIYFDYNYPVETNEAVTNVGSVTLSTSDIIKGKDAVNVYPNPTKGDVNIKADSKINSVEVYDAQGRIIQKQNLNAEEAKISIHNNSLGIYIFKIKTEKETITKKVIKN